MAEETVSIYETDTKIQTSVYDTETTEEQIQASFNDTENVITETVLATQPIESSISETTSKEYPAEVEKPTEKSMLTSIVSESAKDSYYVEDEEEEKEQHVQDLEHIVSMDERVEKVQDLEKIDLTDEYVERIDDLVVGGNNKSVGETPVKDQNIELLDDAHVMTEDDEPTTSSDFEMRFEPKLFLNNELVLKAPPSTPVQEAVSAENSEAEDSQLSQVLTETATEDLEKPAGVETKDIDKRNSDRGSDVKKSVSTRKTNFRTSTTGDIPAKYGDTEFDSGREPSMTENKAEETKQRAECIRYGGVEKFAVGFIDSIIDASITNIITNRSPYSGEASPCSENQSRQSSMHTYVEIFGTFTRWPRIQEFSRDVGQTTINDFMLTWDYNEDWLYCINFLLEQSDECSDYYFYEAKWSIPSKPYPIPQATASIYFTIEVSRIKPIYCPVDVIYVFEGSRFIHAPGKIKFQEQWLFDIIDAKIKLYKQIIF